MEIWKDIKEYKNRYQVSNYGRVRSLRANLILKPIIHKSGHLTVNLYKNQKLKQLYIHRLVAEAFIPNPNGYEHVHHKDHNPENNMVENLEWISKEEHTTLHQTDRTNAAAKKLNKRVDQIDKITGEVLHQWESSREVVKELGFVQSDITRCCNGIRKTHNGFIWKYVLN